jgi:hypothetical protein
MTNLERWNYFLRDIPSPQPFIDWTFYYMIGSAMERRIWWGAQEFATYPNMYIVFIANPGIGKSMAAEVGEKQIWKLLDVVKEGGKTEPTIHRGPNQVTCEALISYMNKNYKVVEVPQPDGSVIPYTYSALALNAGGELGNLLKSNTNDMIRFMTQAWDCGDFWKETKTQGNDVIKNMCMSLLGCATPEWVESSVKSTLLSEGLTARTIFVWADKSRQKKAEIDIDDDQRRELSIVREHMRKLTTIYGQLDIRPEVREWMKLWYEKYDVRINNDKKLDDYYGRKLIHVRKTAIAMHFADKTDLTIRVSDCERALEFLNMTEMNMHKALCGVGVNPLVKLSDMMTDYMAERPDGVTMPELLVQFYSEAPRGKKDIEDVIVYLKSINRVEESKVVKEMYFPKSTIKAQQETLNLDSASIMPKIITSTPITEAPVIEPIATGPTITMRL